MRKLLILVLIILFTFSISLVVIKKLSNKGKGVPPSTYIDIDRNGNIQFIDDQKIVSFYYPPGAKSIQSKSPTPIGGLSFLASYNNNGAEGTWTITLIAIPLDKDGLNQTDELSKIKESIPTYKTYSEVKDTILGREPAITYSSNDKTSKYIETIHNGMYYSIGFGGGNKSPNDDKAIENAYNTITGTLRFIK